MPESGGSGQNGTRIRSFNSRCNKPRSSPLSPASTSNCHSPFKQSQSERANCGRGYSERGIIINVLLADKYLSATILPRSADCCQWQAGILLCFGVKSSRNAPHTIFF